MRTIVFSLILLSVASCKNPADDVAKAKVQDEMAPAASPAPSAPTDGKEFKFASTSSKIEWTGSKVTGSHNGGFNQFSGSIQLADGNIEASSIRIEIDTKSIFSDNEKLTGHLKSNDFFGSETHPAAQFSSTKIQKAGGDSATHTISGNLTMNGVTKGVTFPATVKLTAGAISATSEFSINRQDWNMRYPGSPDDLIRDEVVIKLTIAATATQS